jgi:hypothetical protein
MKKILLLLLAAIAMVTVVPAAHAFEKDQWPDKTLHQLYARMDSVKVYRDRYGASPRIRDQFDRLHFGIDDLTARVRDHAGDPKAARAKAAYLSDLMSQVEAEYHDRAHRDHLDIHISTGQ